MKKSTENDSLICQIKAIPNQLKLVIVGFIVFVAALAFALPGINSKSLQGNVLNLVKDKVGGYGYTEEFVGAFSYAYDMRFVNTNNINDADLFGVIRNAEVANIITQFAIRNELNPILINQGYPNANTTRGYFLKYVVLTVWPGDYANDEAIYAKAKAEGLTASVNYQYLQQSQTKGYAYLTLQRLNQTMLPALCSIPANVLACSLMLGDCPQQCRPVVCRVPENVLACQLGTDQCPQECRFGWNQTGEVIKDVLISNMKFEATNNRQANVSVIMKNVGTVQMPIDSVKTQIYINGNELPEGTYFIDQSVPTSIQPGDTKVFMASVFLTGANFFTYDSLVTANVSTYPEKDQDINNNYMKVYLTGNINGDVKQKEKIVPIMDVAEATVVQEVKKVVEKIEEVKEEVKEEVREESKEEVKEEIVEIKDEKASNNLLEMISNLLK